MSGTGRCPASIDTDDPSKPWPAIQIEQDHEMGYDGEVSSRINVFWAKGHGHETDKFIRAVIDHCLEYDEGIPAISWEDRPQEVWQHTESAGECMWEYIRANEPSWNAGRKAEPITLLDLDRRGRGARKCHIQDCREPWSISTPVQVCIEPGMGGASINDPRMTVYITLCREHLKRFPEPSYLVCLIPVGATILLPKPAEGGDRKIIGASPACSRPGGSQGVDLIRAERQRQVAVEGWSADHDERHVCGELVAAAAVYLGVSGVGTWPWSDTAPSMGADAIADLVKAGALIAAEIDRLLHVRTTSSSAELEAGRG
jgi:hypothetical protein